jgi:hypothetical protein
MSANAKFNEWLASRFGLSVEELFAQAPTVPEVVKTYVDNHSDEELGYTPVPNTRTVNSHALSSDVTVSKSDVGLGNADNTSDANKPVSTAQQTALDLKANIAGGIQSASVTLTNAQILALPTTPVVVVAAPGSNFAISVLAAHFVTNYTSVYTNAAATLEAQLLPSVVACFIRALGLFNSTTRRIARFPVAYGYLIAISTSITGDYGARSGSDNTALTFSVNNQGSGDFTGGHAANTLKVTVLYTIDAV